MPGRSPLFAALLTTTLLAGPVLAQTPSTDSGAATLPTPASPSSAAASAMTNPFQRFDDLSVKGWATPFPATGDTMIQDRGGIRSTLADLGIGFLGLSVNSTTYDLGAGGVSGRQAYNGEKFTYNTGIQAVFATYDLDRIGIPGGQLFGAATALTQKAEHLNGPRDVRMTSLGYHQSLFDGKIEVKLGYFDNSQDFAGMAVGGNVATGALGPQARIPVQVGLSAAGFGTPTLTVRARLSDHLYVKGGVARSMSPDGFEAELAANDSGLKWSVPRAKALYVGEGGYNRPSGEDKSLWIRVGGIYNTSDYRRFVDGEAEDNWGVYAAIDAQLTQPDALMPFRGVYGGFTVNYAPDEQNLFTNYYEGRVYGIGLLPNRPFDMASVVASYNGLGRPGLDAIAPTGESDDHTVSVIGSYAYRLKPGVFLQPGAGVVFNPSFYPKGDTALNLYLGVTFIL